MLIFITKLFGFGRKKPSWPPSKPLEEVTDEELMVLYAGGEARAFEPLLNRHERGIYNFILRSVHNPARAEDLTQDVFLRVIKSAPRYEKSAKFTTWLYTIARNICIDQSRRKSTRKEVSLNRSIGKDDAEEGKSFLDNVADRAASSGGVAVARKEFVEKLQNALQELPDEQREVFVMRQFSGLKFREIANIVGIPENTVKSRMRYALEALRGHLEEFRGYSFDLDEAREVGSQ